jgi:hypothetical protein
MDVLNHSKLHKYNIIGLKEICRHNRDIFINYNVLSKQDLLNYFKSKLNDGCIVNVPPFIYNNNSCIARYKIKQVI